MANSDNPANRDEKGRFIKGCSGYPKGTKHKLTRFVESVTQAKSEEIVQTIVDRALAGDTTLLANFQKVFWSPKRGDYLKLNNLKGPNPMRTLLDAVADGQVTDIQAANLARVIQTVRLEADIEEIKQQLEALRK